MAGGRRYKDRLTLLTAGLVDSGYGGQQTPDWDNAVELTVPASVQPLASTEDSDRRQTTVTRWRALVPPPGQLLEEDVPMPEVLSTARARHRGHVYEVEGDVELHPDLSARQHHQTLLLRRVTDGS